MNTMGALAQAGVADERHWPYIDMYEQKAYFVEHQIIFWVASFIDRDSRAAGL